MKLTDFARDNLFNKLKSSTDPEAPIVWWRETVEKDGYIMVSENGEDFHTYHYPPDWY